MPCASRGILKASVLGATSARVSIGLSVDLFLLRVTGRLARVGFERVRGVFWIWLFGMLLDSVISWSLGHGNMVTGLSWCEVADPEGGMLPGGPALLDDGTAAVAVTDGPFRILRSSTIYCQSIVL